MAYVKGAVLALALMLVACGNRSAPLAQASISPSSLASPSRSAGQSPSAESSPDNCGAIETCPPTGAPAQVFDPVRNEILSFGGFDYPNGQTKVFDTTWAFKNGMWAQLHPTHVPAARDTADIVFDAKAKVVVMYGGRDVPQSIAAGTGGEVGQITYSDDTWIWNGSDWTQQHPVHSPRIFVPDITFDLARQNVVLLGYVGQMQTWTWDGVDWTHQVKSEGLPQPVVLQTRLSYDPATAKVMCFGGRNDAGETLSTPWLWDGTSWSKLQGVSSPHIGYFGPMAPEGIGHALLIFDWQSRTTWRWNGATFELLSPPHQPDIYPEVMALDPSQDRVILAGLTEAQGPYAVWQWTGSDWVSAAL
jgi:hypothetical protein